MAYTLFLKEKEKNKSPEKHLKPGKRFWNSKIGTTCDLA